MKVDPTLQPPPAPPRAAPVQPSISFKDVLGEAAARSGARAYGFAELGMFGTRGAAPSPAASTPVSATHAAPAALEKATVPVQRSSANAEARALAPAHVAKAEAQLPVRTSAPTHTARASADPAGEALAMPADGAEPAQAEADTRAGTTLLRRRLQALAEGKLRMKLTFAETAGLADIVASGEPLDPEGTRRLRERVAGLLAEHGLTLGRFTLNGTGQAAFQPPHARRI
jgi:hypothetical protein